MAKTIAEKKKAMGKLPKGPHPLTLKGERNETRAQEKKESKPFEAAERKLGIEGKYAGKRAKEYGGKKSGKGGY